MKRALLLNASYEPLHFISDERAITLYFKGRVEILDVDGRKSVWDETFDSPSIKFAIPATLRLISRVHKKWKTPRFRKKVLFNRDNWECQYCGDPLTWANIEIEHVMPSSRGGQTTWKNCVASCHSCNKKKGCKTPSEAGMPLRKVPTEPSQLHFWDTMRSSDWHEDWDIFLERVGQ